MATLRKKDKARSRRRPSSAPRKKFRRSTARRASTDDVELRPGKSKTATTLPEGAARLFWHVFHKGSRAGRAFIVALNPESKDHPDASITVELNEASQGRGIGTIAFRRASELSGYIEVSASIKKSNIASKIAASRAGFEILEDEPGRALVMVWRKRS
jgi:hypothetical protein